jgi:hypothetical protein
MNLSIDPSSIEGLNNENKQEILIEDGTKASLGFNNEVGTVNDSDIKR